MPPPSIHIIQNPVETSSAMHHSNVVPTTPMTPSDSGGGPRGFGTGTGPMQLHSKRGSGQVSFRLTILDNKYVMSLRSFSIKYEERWLVNP